MQYNKIRKLINEGKPTLATRVWHCSPMTAELVGASGQFDYFEFVAEYSPFSQEGLANMARAAELTETGSMIKVDFANRFYVAQKAVAVGFQSVLFTDHHTADEVRETIRYMKPDCAEFGGRFGYPNNRYIGYTGRLSATDHIKRLNDVVLAFMIEKQDSVEQIEDICSIPGVDMVQFGPNDYSMSNGCNPLDMIDKVKDTDKRIIEVALEHGVRPRIEIYGPTEMAKPYIELGVKDFMWGDETAILGGAYAQNGAEMRSLLGTN